jgi:hypothetical protein
VEIELISNVMLAWLMLIWYEGEIPIVDWWLAGCSFDVREYYG